MTARDTATSRTDGRPTDDLAATWGTEVAYTTNSRAPLAYHPRPRTTLDMLAGSQKWAPRTFLVQGRRRISYEVFLRGIAMAGQALRAQGVQVEDRVVIHAYNAPEVVLAVWASWWAGAVPVLTNRWWRAPELEAIAQQVEPVVVLSDAKEKFNIDAAQHDLRSLAEYLDNDTGHPVGPPPNEPRGEEAPALILFTSGSSGTPKGVVLPHRSVIANQHNLLWRSRKLPQLLDPDAPQEVMLTSTPLFHIGGVSNFITQFLVGGRLVLTEGRFDAGEILQLIETEGVHRWAGVPTTAARVLSHPSFETTDLSSLRSFPIGGAPVSQSLLDKMRRNLTQLEKRGLSNTWGLTESGGFVTLAVNRDMEQYPGTVGRPYPVTELQIQNADEHGIGEILVRSPTIMLGYLGEDDGTVDDQGWLHTGDLGRINADGYLFLEGRLKDIVIRGGENIACAHVEQALLSHPAVTEAVAFGLPHEDLGEELAAAVRYRAGEHLSESDLAQHLRIQVARFEIPTRWYLTVDPFPTLPGEKIDKRALRDKIAEQ